MESSTFLHNKHLLHKLFGDLDDQIIEDIFTIGRQIELNTSDYLFHQGDEETVLYLVLSGRLRAIKEDAKGVRILGDIGEGEPVGEFALFTKEPRMASVIAIRKSIVLEFTKSEYLTLITKTPSLAASLTSFVIHRLRRNTFQQNKSTPPKNIALIHLQSEAELSSWTEKMGAYFGNKGTNIQFYDSNSIEESTNPDFFSSLEQQEGLNILVCNDSQPSWSHQCIVYADLVVVATDFDADSGIYPIEKELQLYEQSILNKKTYLLLLHKGKKQIPVNTARWFENRSFNLHIHLRASHEKDMHRFCRIITNTANGLVLSGGGAKGYAHLGVVKALMERGIDIDFLGGTSAGAIYGMTMSFLDFENEKVEKITVDSIKKRLTSNDFDLPLISIKTGNKIKTFLQETFGESHTEDLWVNSYCVSTNFSNSVLTTHKRGLLWKHILASMSVPGIFPPVVIDNYLHIDGAVMDNLPIEAMYSYPVGNILAVSLSGLPEEKVDYDEMPSGWSLLWSKITGKKKIKIPGISSIMINALNLNNRQKQRSNKNKASHYLELDLKEFGFMDDKKWEEILNRGYQQTQDYLGTLEEGDRLWQK